MPRRPVSQPAVGDIDGDGAPEVVVVDAQELQALEWTGTEFVVKWSQAIVETGGSRTPPTTFDFDGDGAAEVLYRDMLRWFLLDGVSGTVIAAPSFESGTVMEVPVIADIDNAGLLT